MMRSGGKILVDQLEKHGVTHAFGVPGESYLAVLDAFYNSPVQFVICRQEGGAAFMAEAYGKLHGRAGICFVTRGPGACNASIGVHTAKQDSTPMLLFIGQVGRGDLGREAFQEVDYCFMFKDLAKDVIEIHDAERIPELVSKAFHLAQSGRQGPVVVVLPEDMLRDEVDVEDRSVVEMTPSLISPLKLPKCERPLILVGGGNWTDRACEDLKNFAEKNKIPVVTGFRRQDIMDHRSPAYAGVLTTGVSPELVAYVNQADLVIAIGTRLSEITTQGYSLWAEKKPYLVQFYPQAEEIGAVYPADVAVVAGPQEVLSCLSGFSGGSEAWYTKLRQNYVDWSTPATPTSWAGSMMWLRAQLPHDAIITNDAGNFSGFGHRYLHFGRPGRQLGPTSGAMGYGIPSAIAASLLYPGRIVIGMSGDGGALMNGQELATAKQFGATPLILIFNNGRYGTIRTHQDRHYPGRVVGTDLMNPDFCVWAKSFGAKTVHVQDEAGFKKAYQDYAKHPELTVLHLDYT